MSKKSTLFSRLSDEPLSRPPRHPLQSQRYVVGWPNLGVIKIGSTMNGRARWGTFLARGAALIDLACYDCSTTAEAYLKSLIERDYAPAFQEKSEAKSILGNRGAGYLECYRVPVSDWHIVQRMALEGAAYGTH